MRILIGVAFAWIGASGLGFTQDLENPEPNLREESRDQLQLDEGGGSGRVAVPRYAPLTVRVVIQAGGPVPLAGVTVGVHEEELLGIPVFLAAGETDASGRVVLQIPRGNRPRYVSVRSQGSLLSTLNYESSFLGIGKLPFTVEEPLQPGASTVELTVRTLPASSAFSLSTTEEFWQKRWMAFRLQDQGHRMLSWARQEFRGQLDAKKVRSYFPHPGNDGGRSFARGPDKIHLTGDSLFVLRHELGHSLWFQAGLFSSGGAHSLSEPTNPKLALSEGFATFVGNWAGATVGGESGGLMFGGAEQHPASPIDVPESLRTRYRYMHQFNEVNVTCSLWDIADRTVDSAGLLPGLSDRVSGQGPRQILADLRDDYAGKWNYLWNGRPTLLDLYRRKWRARYGWLVAETLELNGVSVD